MDFLTLLTQSAASAKYPIIFCFFFLEGSTTNFLSSGIAATGALNIWIIWIAAIVIEILVDLFYYYLGGKLSGKQISSRVSKVEGSNFINTLDVAYKAHPGLTLMVVKFLGPFAIPGIMYVGKLKALKVVKFIQYAFIVAFVRGTLLTFLGYMVGKGLSQFLKIYDFLKVLGIVLIVVVLLYVIYKSYQSKIEEWFLNIFKKIK